MEELHELQRRSDTSDTELLPEVAAPLPPHLAHIANLAQPRPIFPGRGWLAARRQARAAASRADQKGKRHVGLTRAQRVANYYRQNGCEKLTPKQVRRVNHEMHEHHARTSVGAF
jgi:hypothetical protein